MYIGLTQLLWVTSARDLHTSSNTALKQQCWRGAEHESRTIEDFQPGADVNNWGGKWTILNRAYCVLSGCKGQHCRLFATVIDSFSPLKCGVKPFTDRAICQDGVGSVIPNTAGQWFHLMFCPEWIVYSYTSPDCRGTYFSFLLNNASLHKTGITNLTSSGTINPIWTGLYITLGILQSRSSLRGVA